MDMNKLPAYALVKQQHLDALNSEGYILKHKKSGARLTLISNDDENKVFQIGFKTPPKNSTGVAHIIEHTVLCGSKKYPLKDPFVELVKGSLNTFINAMTYPDKTVYPVASYNDQDFQNLMDVYLDAVFHPNIYDREEIFKQEGWHYEMEDEQSPLTINGVVYNEMKGAYSSADEQISEEITKALYPDTCYSNDSGGDPKVIPSLTREEYLEFHRTYYHPSNSFIYLYGDMDMVEKLTYLDEEYLSKYSYLDVDANIEKQASFDKRAVKEANYSISSEESAEGKSIFAFAAALEELMDTKTYIAMGIVNYALMQCPGAPLKQALLDEGLGNDISGTFESSIRQPYFGIEAKNTKKEDFERFQKVLMDTLEKIVSEGLDKKTLEAGINTYEFRYREADFGNFPKGLLYVLQSMDSWLYDEEDPFKYIEALDAYAELRKAVDTDYFETLIKKYLIENKHSAYVIMNPEKGLLARKEEALKKELEKKKESMTKDEIKDIVEATKALKLYQETPSTPEELRTIPMLTRDDIKKDPAPINNEVTEKNGVTLLHHNMFTNGIHYLHFMFEVKNLKEEMLPILGIFKSVWGLLDTEHYTYASLSSEIDRTTGGIGANLRSFEKDKEFGSYEVRFSVGTKTFYEKMDVAVSLIEEIIEHTKFNSPKRLKELISEARSRMQDDISAMGSQFAVARCDSYFTELGYVKDAVNGIGFYEYLADLDDHFEARKDQLIKDLEAMNKEIFRKENLVISSTCDEKEFARLDGILEGFYPHLWEKEVPYERPQFKPETKNEGFITSSQVQYVGQTGNYRREGFEFNGAMNLLQTILSYEYLWVNIRVKGGAYGCQGAMLRSGRVVLSTYRDPNLEKSLEIFAKIPEYLADFDIEEREMTKYIIGTFGNVDAPMNPMAKGIRSASLYLRGITEEDLKKSRLETINATVEDIRALAAPMEAVIKAKGICVVGNEDRIKAAKDIFKEIKIIK
ncbi:MAG: insulinase family protein [Lachnospiraceae bacterium]|nr:insulinase family protein [Lachnospiraceae bacterium]